MATTAQKSLQVAAELALAVPEGEESIPQLGVLDEDDEFEEFETQDWSDADTALAHLSNKAVQISSAAGATGGQDQGAAPGASVGLSIAGGNATGGGSAGSASGGPADHLWQDNWDDDDVEDDFSKALRAELDKASVNQVTASS
ncbi:hypothetical protein K437DRAFT_253835 [Tilletiaria anomala UBC 951]|uniref:26S proteasome complex subunit SEM1 n=1 Tax=Tilletiaria anomala (strain ATCC 24038 / CBS 436.72 / UBC 951) TaxID=1037660 RepID=A0A066WQJ5_TILAU|nr:uncharacterized protein K437DRAFT_253835 [Tilletiaria anomala UBC 951]KDN52885.1 hypothetical protein K437DRAFT_253835 [Tilletiaria anomala UBC 951]